MPSLSRSENVCSSCRTRKKKCDGKRPQCSACVRRGEFCLYRTLSGPMAWHSLIGIAEAPSDLAGAPSFDNAMDFQSTPLQWPVEFPTPEPPVSQFISIGDTDMPGSESTSSHPSLSLFMEFIDIYFQKFYIYLPIIHKTRFISEVNNKGTKGISQALLFAICAASSIQHPDSTVRKRHGDFYEMAKSEVSKEINGNTDVIPSLQATAIMIFHSLEMMEFSSPWLLLGNAWRKAEVSGYARVDGKARLSRGDMGMMKDATWVEKEECRRALWSLFLFDRSFCTTDLALAIDHRHLVINLPMPDYDFCGINEPLSPTSVGCTANVNQMITDLESQARLGKTTLQQYIIVAHMLLGHAGYEIHQPNFDHATDGATIDALLSTLLKLRLILPRHATELSAADSREFPLVIWLNGIMTTITLLLHHQPLLEGETLGETNGNSKNWPYCIAASRSFVSALRDMCRISMGFASNSFLLCSAFLCVQILLIENTIPSSPYTQASRDPGLKEDLELLVHVFRHFKEALGPLGRRYYDGFIYFSRFDEEQSRAVKSGALIDMLRPCDRWPSFDEEEEIHLV